MVVFVDVFNIFLNVEKIIEDDSVEGSFDEMLRTENHVVATLDTLVVAIVDELLCDSVLAKGLEDIFGIVHTNKLWSVVVGVVKAILCDETA